MGFPLRPLGQPLAMRQEHPDRIDRRRIPEYHNVWRRSKVRLGAVVGDLMGAVLMLGIYH